MLEAGFEKIKVRSSKTLHSNLLFLCLMYFFFLPQGNAEEKQTSTTQPSIPHLPSDVSSQTPVLTQACWSSCHYSTSLLCF